VVKIFHFRFTKSRVSEYHALAALSVSRRKLFCNGRDLARHFEVEVLARCCRQKRKRNAVLPSPFPNRVRMPQNGLSFVMKSTFRSPLDHSLR
jgi:hypothetical protein